MCTYGTCNQGMGQREKNALTNGWKRAMGGWTRDGATGGWTRDWLDERVEGNGLLARNRQRKANNYPCRHMFT